MDAGLLIVNFLLTALEDVIIGLFIFKVLPIRMRWLFWPLFLIIPTGLYIVKLLVPWNFQIWLTILSIVSSLALPIIFSKAKFGFSLLVVLLFSITKLAGDFLITLIVSLYYGDELLQFLSDMTALIVLKLLLALLILVFCFIVYMILKRFSKKSRGLSLVPFTIAPLISAIIIAIFMMVLQKYGILSETIVPLSLLAVSFAASFVVFFRALSKLQREKELKDKTALAEQQLAVQMSYYQRLEDNIEAANRMRHDISNQIQATKILIDRGEDDKAQKQLDELSANLRSKAGSVYTVNPIVDAVLIDKAEVCQRSGIELSADVALPAETTVDGVSLCSVFANMLDNAIAACARLEDDRRISIESYAQSGLLVVKCENPVSRDAEAPKRQPDAGGLPAHGLGTGILESIARRYGGTFKSGAEDGVYKCSIVLTIPDDSTVKA